MTSSERLKEARASAGFESARSASERFGWTYSTYAGHENGSRSYDVDAAEIYARAFKVRPEWLAFGTVAEVHATEAPGADFTVDDEAFVSVPRFRLALSGGGGREIDEEAPIDVIPFTKDFVRRRLGRRGVHQLIMVDAAGDSMEPLIHHNDLLMIDLSERALDGSIMGFRYQGAAMLKRLTKTPEGILVSSENPSAPSFTIQSETEEDFRVYGRVCWIGRTV